MFTRLFPVIRPTSSEDFTKIRLYILPLVLLTNRRTGRQTKRRIYMITQLCFTAVITGGYTLSYLLAYLQYQHTVVKAVSMIYFRGVSGVNTDLY